MEEIDISDKPSISFTIEQITNFLCSKAVFEMKKQDENNITTLGGIGFFFRENDGQQFLCYTKHPQYWNIKHIFNDVEEYKKHMLVNKGIEISED